MQFILRYILPITVVILGATVILQTYRLSGASQRAQEALEQAKEYRGSLMRSQAIVEALEASARNQAKVLEEQGNRISALRKERNKKEHELNEVIRTQQDAADWASTTIPDSVLGVIGTPD